MMDDATPLISELCNGIAPGVFVNRFVVVAEVINPDGSRAVIVDTDDAASEWDMLGLLHYAIREGPTVEDEDDED